MVPEVVIRPTPPYWMANHRAPSGPADISSAAPTDCAGYMEMSPEVVIRPMVAPRPRLNPVNHSAPSGPLVTFEPISWRAGRLYSWVTPAGVNRAIFSV